MQNSKSQIKIQNFLESFKKIFQKEGIINYDEKILNERLADDKKSSVVTVATLTYGAKVFFKAIKPWADAHKIMDYQKGIAVSEIMKKAGVLGYPNVISSGEHQGIHYIIEEVLPIKKTLDDEKIKLLSSVDVERIVNLYKNNQQKLSDYLTKNPEEATFLYPHDWISQGFAFLGMMMLFEDNLNKKSIIKGSSVKRLALSLINDNSEIFFNAERLYLLHGDFAPHNIVLDRQIYFVDWERTFTTFNPLIGESYDLANLYISFFQNPSAQKVFSQDSLSFKLCLLFHLLSKMNNIVMFGDAEKHKKEMDWMIRIYSELKI